MAFLTIGMPTYDDYAGLYATIQALRMYQDIEDVELLVIDNYGCNNTRNFLNKWTDVKYVEYKDKRGTAIAKEQVFRYASSPYVLCIDSHVFLQPCAVAKLKQFYKDNPDTNDLYHGPLLYDNMTSIATEMKAAWNSLMWGVWHVDERGKGIDNPPYEIWGQGMGLFTCRKDAWAGFNTAMVGFGGEEGYAQEKFRKRGDKVYCLPFLRWVHRFTQPGQNKYNSPAIEPIKNYLLGAKELDLQLEPMISHFLEFCTTKELCKILSEVYEKPTKLSFKVQIGEETLYC